MIDITPKIRAVKLLAHVWTRERVCHALTELAGLYPGAAIDWEEGDEEWGRVVCGGKAVAIVSARCPFAFVEANEETLVQPISTRLGITVVTVPDFDARSITIDPPALSNFSEGPLTENVSCESVSVNDIWWATV